MITLIAVALLGSTAIAQSPNKLTKKEQKDGWKLLFDGTTTAGWHTYLKPSVGAAWSAKDGALNLDPGSSDADRGDLVTNEAFENYDLNLEWKVGEGVNSGIIFGVNEDPKYGATYTTGLEMQVLDNIKASDNKKENHLAGSLYDIIGTAANSKPKPVGEWNHARILHQNNHVTLWLNGVKTAETDLKNEEWKSLVVKTKFKSWPAFATFSKGHIALQDHDGKVAYRNIKIKML
ncbi:MAG: 3-keto-disaccharide hydrolase [Sphingobacteriaceae bacterium]